MTRMHLAAALAAALLVSPAGCKRNQKSKQDSPAHIEGLAAVPASIDVVIGIDVERLSKSELARRAITRMFMADPGLEKELDELLGGCQIAPAEDVRSIVLAVDTDGAQGLDRMLVASGELSESAISACVGKHLGEIGGRLSQTMVDGRPHYFADAPPGRVDVWFAFGSKETVVVASSAELLADAMGTSERIADRDQMAALIERSRTDAAAIWAAGRVTQDIGQGLAEASGGRLDPPQAMFATAELEEGLRVRLGVVMASGDQAKDSVSMAKTQLGVLAQLAQKHRLGDLVRAIEVSSEGQTLEMALAVSKKQLATLIGPIDTEPPDDQTTAPSDETEQGVDSHGQGDAAAGSETPVPEQGQAN